MIGLWEDYSDFRQALAVVPQGTRIDEISEFLKSRSHRRNIIKLELTVNTRCTGYYLCFKLST